MTYRQIWETIIDALQSTVTRSCFCIFLKKWANPGLFFVYFRSFQTNNTIFTTNQCEKCPNDHSVPILCQDLNPRPFIHELSPITTRPGLLPKVALYLIVKTIGNETFFPFEEWCYYFGLTATLFSVKIGLCFFLLWLAPLPGIAMTMVKMFHLYNLPFWTSLEPPPHFTHERMNERTFKVVHWSHFKLRFNDTHFETNIEAKKST